VIKSPIAHPVGLFVITAPLDDALLRDGPEQCKLFQQGISIRGRIAIPSGLLAVAAGGQAEQWKIDVVYD